MNNKDTYELTVEQSKALQTINERIKKIRQENGTNIAKAVREVIPNWSKEFVGQNKPDEPSKNHAERILMLSAMLGCPIEKIAPSKASVAALANGLTALFMNEDINEIVNVYVKEKEPEISESEAALQGAFSEKVTLSKRIKGLVEDELKTLNAAAHAAFHASVQILKKVWSKRAKDESNPDLEFPKGAENFLSYLIAASNGRTDQFEMSDKLITETSGISSATIKRNRNDLRNWMQATGCGIIDIEMETKKPTKYRVNLLNATTEIMHHLVSGEHANPDNLLVVAGLTGRLLTEGTDKLKTQVSDAELSSAKELNSRLTDAVGTLPSPNIVISESAEGRSEGHYQRELTKISNEISRAVTMASEGNLPDVEKRLNRFAVVISKAKEDGSEQIDIDKAKDKVKSFVDEIESATKTELNKATEKAESEKAETGTVSTETQKELATAYAATISEPEQADEELKSAIATAREKVFLAAAVAERLTATPGFENAFDDAYIEIQSMCDEAFKR